MTQIVKKGRKMTLMVKLGVKYTNGNGSKMTLTAGGQVSMSVTPSPTKTKVLKEYLSLIS